MSFTIYDSYRDNKSEFIDQMQNLIGERLICVYESNKLKVIKNTFAEVYDELEKKDEHIVVTSKGDDVIINDFLIKRTTELGKSIFVAWWYGHSYETTVFDAFKIDSPLLEPLYYSLGG